MCPVVFVVRFVESILSDGRSYLCGDTISMADIAFASLAFPVLLPDETASVFVEYDPRSLPRGYVETIKRYERVSSGTLHISRVRMRLKGGCNTCLEHQRIVDNILSLPQPETSLLFLMQTPLP